MQWIQSAQSGRGVACAVCGSREVHSDWVEHGRWLLLAECAHCDHRWTQVLPEIPAPVHGTHRVSPTERRPEVASAA